MTAADFPSNRTKRAAVLAGLAALFIWFGWSPPTASTATQTAKQTTQLVPATKMANVSKLATVKCTGPKLTHLVGTDLVFERHWKCPVVRAKSITVTSKSAKRTTMTLWITCQRHFFPRLHGEYETTKVFSYTVDQTSNPEISAVTAASTCNLEVVLSPHGALQNVTIIQAPKG